MESAVIVLVLSAVCVFVIGKVRQVRSGEEREQINWSSLWDRFRKAGQGTAADCRGYIGILGAILTFSGLYLPFLRVVFFDISYMDALESADSRLPAIAIAGILAVAVFYTVACHRVALLISFFLTIAFLIQTFSDNPFSEIFHMAQSGFWAMGIGLLLMCASPFLGGLNASIRNRLKL